MLHIQRRDLTGTKNFKVKEVRFECLKPRGRSFSVEFDVDPTKNSKNFEMTLSLKWPDQSPIIIRMDDLLPSQFVPNFLMSSTLILDEDHGFERGISVALIKLKKVSVILTLEREDKDSVGEITAYVQVSSPSGRTNFFTEGRISEKAVRHCLTPVKK